MTVPPTRDGTEPTIKSDEDPGFGAVQFASYMGVNRSAAMDVDLVLGPGRPSLPLALRARALGLHSRPA